MDERFDVIVIGGGAAGLMAAVSAAANGARTAIVEQKDRVGRKILSTGNGKCNYTNGLQGVAYYRGENPAFVVPVMKQFGFDETVAFFKKLGIFPKNRNGYYYPASGQASAVLDVLLMELARQKVAVYTEYALQSVEKKDGLISLKGEGGRLLAGAVIFATGLLAAPKTGSNGSAFPFIEGLGHHFVEITPALVALHCGGNFWKQLAGVRTGGSVELFVDGKLTARADGELQLTDYGISGIPVFEVSRFATKALAKGQSVTAALNFLSQMEKDEAKALLAERFFENARGKTVEEALIGLFPKKLGAVLLKQSGIGAHRAAETLTAAQCEDFVKICTAFPVTVTGSNSFEQAQVCAGGVDTAEIDAQTMESKLVRNVYFSGEVVDIDGTCGGYNLQWAWSSGYVAGMHAARQKKKGTL